MDFQCNEASLDETVKHKKNPLNLSNVKGELICGNRLLREVLRSP